MRAYRARKRAVERERLTATVISLEAAQWLRGPAGWRARLIAWRHCPVCGVLVWAGVRRRADAVYCSPKCRLRAWRARRTSLPEAGDLNG